MTNMEYLNYTAAIRMALAGKAKDMFKEWDKIKLWGLPYYPIIANWN